MILLVIDFYVVSIVGVPIAAFRALPPVLTHTPLLGILEEADALIVLGIEATVNLDGIVKGFVLTIVKLDDVVVIKVVTVVVGILRFHIDSIVLVEVVLIPITATAKAVVVVTAIAYVVVLVVAHPVAVTLADTVATICALGRVSFIGIAIGVATFVVTVPVYDERVAT